MAIPTGPKSLKGRVRAKKSLVPSAHTKRIKGGADLGAPSPLAGLPLDPEMWWQYLNLLIAHFNWQHGALNKGVSFKTMHERAKFLVAFFKELRRIRIKLDPRSLDNKHIKIMVARWIERGLKAPTIQTYLSFLRVFAYWIEKAGLVLRPEFYVEDASLVKRTYVAKQDKSWCANGVDAQKKIAEIATYSEHASVQLDVASAFGLRVKEVLMMQPRLSVVPASETGIKNPKAESYLLIARNRGSKGGRDRYVAIDTEMMWKAIKRAIALAPATDSHLGYPGRSLKQSIDQFYRIMERFGITKDQLGVTAHGLRHQYANDRYEASTGVKAPLRGGPAIDPEKDTQARLEVSEKLGHARKQISSAYLGSSVVMRSKATQRLPGTDSAGPDST